jgi:hypothetical protein
MEKTVEDTIEIYRNGLRKSGGLNVTVNAADMLACFEHLIAKAEGKSAKKSPSKKEVGDG